MGFLCAPCSGGRLPSSLCGKLLAWELSSGGFAGPLLGAGHCVGAAAVIKDMRIPSGSPVSG